MPRTPEENERIRQKAKENILYKAMELFINQGYHATSISHIAKEAEISKGLLYNYFKGKEDLLATIVEERIIKLMEVMEGALTLDTPADQLKYIVNHAIDNVYTNPQVHRFFLHLQTQPEADKELTKYSKRIVEENARQFELQCEMFEKLTVESPRKKSLYFSSTLQGVMLMIATYPQSFPVGEIKTQIIEKFCQSSSNE